MSTGRSSAAGRTRLSLLCEKVIEAGWLAAVVLVPLFFNPYSYRSFEPDKTTLLRSIALVMVLAWLVKLIEEGGGWKGERGRGRREGGGGKGEVRPSSILYLPFSIFPPLVMPALLLALVYLLTTVTSIVPRLSFWGSYQRLQGTYTTLSYLVIFLLSLLTLRTREQLERLITVILLTSLPISLYGIMQHYGLDPIAWSGAAGEVTLRVISTMGNPIFVAAYLIMVVPLTLSRLVRLNLLSGGGRQATDVLLAGYYALLLLAQLLCIFFTQSRGPLMGLLGGVLLFPLLLAIVRGNKQAKWAIVAVAVLFGLFLMVLNVPHSPLEPIRTLPYMGLLGRVLDIQSKTVRQRMLAWEGVIELSAADPLRTLIGYGPESMIVAFNPHFRPELASLMIGETFDRAHNEALDVLATTGLIGLVVYLLLFGSLFYYGLKGLGLIQGSRQRLKFLVLWLGGGLAGGLLPWLVEGKWRFFGVGLALGTIAGFAIYLILYPLAQPRREDTGQFHRSLPSIRLRHLRTSILAALLAAVMAHFIEIQSGIAVVATRTYFWLYVALIVVLGFYQPGFLPVEGTTQAQAASRRRPRRRRDKSRHPFSRRLEPGQASVISLSLLTGLILATLGFSFFSFQFGLRRTGIGVPGLLFAVWLVGGLTVALRSGGGAERGDLLSLYALLSVGWFFLFVLGHWPIVSRDPVGALVVYHIYLLFTMGAVAVALLREESLPAPVWRLSRGWLYPILVAVVVLLVSVTNINPIKADIYYKRGMSYADNRQWDSTIALFQEALKVAPEQDFYYIFLAGACVEKAKIASSAYEREAWLEEGRKALERGKELNPLNPDHSAKLGLLYRVWGEMAVGPAEREDKLRRALEYYSKAAELSPHSLPILTEWGHIYYLLGEVDQAIETYQRALQLNRGYLEAHTLLADAYVALGEWEEATEVYKQAVRLEGEGVLQLKRKAAEEAPDDYVAHQSLALLYEQLGEIALALSEARRAVDLAPASEKSDVEHFIAQLEEQQK
jgi:tetratricopeptide (TPR) repeat protein/O-antigen ligase